MTAWAAILYSSPTNKAETPKILKVEDSLDAVLW